VRPCHTRAHAARTTDCLHSKRGPFRARAALDVAGIGRSQACEGPPGGTPQYSGDRFGRSAVRPSQVWPSGECEAACALRLRAARESVGLPCTASAHPDGDRPAPNALLSARQRAALAQRRADRMIGTGRPHAAAHSTRRRGACVRSRERCGLDPPMDALVSACAAAAAAAAANAAERLSHACDALGCEWVVMQAGPPAHADATALRRVLTDLFDEPDGLHAHARGGAGAAPSLMATISRARISEPLHAAMRLRCLRSTRRCARVPVANGGPVPPVLSSVRPDGRAWLWQVGCACGLVGVDARPAQRALRAARLARRPR
jgi:hypothetical protein